MDGSNPEHYPIADFLQWHEQKELVLNPNFQRGPVWLPPARSYLIDSILHGYPIPKLLLRTKIDRDRRRTIRDVVDGQQRLRTIIDFATNKFTLGPKAVDFVGRRYESLTYAQQDQFLAYKLTTEQLINASDDDVLEVFARINSYTVAVNAAELRNARFNTPFSEAVKKTVSSVRPLWELGVISERDRVRMLDQSLIAEIYGFFIQGIQPGDEQEITRLYERTKEYDEARLPDPHDVESLILEAVDLLQGFKGERIAGRPNFLMLIGALGYLHALIPEGRVVIGEVEVAKYSRTVALQGITFLNQALSGDVESRHSYLGTFVEAAKASTQRIKSRQIRIIYMINALTGSLPGM